MHIQIILLFIYQFKYNNIGISKLAIDRCTAYIIISFKKLKRRKYRSIIKSIKLI
jgi:hypothetical protein